MVVDSEPLEFLPQISRLVFGCLKARYRGPSFLCRLITKVADVTQAKLAAIVVEDDQQIVGGQQPGIVYFSSKTLRP